MRNLDPDRLEFKEHYVLGCVTQTLVFLAWILLHIQPKYTNKLYWYSKDNLVPSDYSAFKILCYVADVFLIMAWLVASIYNKAGIQNVYLDPEDMKKHNNRQNEQIEDVDD